MTNDADNFSNEHGPESQLFLTFGSLTEPDGQRGKDDDRWLWGEALRVVSEARPNWCLFENPPGIDDVGLGGILTDLEAEGYEVAPPLIIPACAVNSPQLRARYWIVAHAKEQRLEGWSNGGERESKESLRFLSTRSGQGNMADSERTGQLRTQKYEDGEQNSRARRGFNPTDNNKGDLADTETTTGFGLQDGKESKSLAQNGRCSADFWRDHVWLPCADGKVRRAPDHTFGVVDGLHRSVLAGLGNSIVPQIAYEVIKAIINTDEKPG